MYPYYLYDGAARLDAHKTIAEINTANLRHNYTTISSLIGNVKQICVVKADAYVHSAEICVPVLIDAGCRFFAVSCIEEALLVREICRDEGSDADILILGYTDPSQSKLLSENAIIQTAVSLEHARALSENAAECGCTLRVHAAIDTGMNRIGISLYSQDDCEDAMACLEEMISLPCLCVEGMFTHFAQSDEERDAALMPLSRTRVQAERFLNLRDKMLQKGKKLFCHVCNSAAAMRFPEYRFDGVRVGIMLYGIYPAPDFENVGIRPVMSLKTVISHIHTAPKGERISYGGTFVARQDTRVATLPIGYADGLLRAYTGASVTVKTSQGDYKARLIGRICMDQCMIDITDIPASVKDDVIIFGQEPEDLRKLAALASTIEYESLCLISARVPRIKK